MRDAHASLRSLICVALCALLVTPSYAARAQGRGVQIRYTPTKRAQVAIWIETADGQFMGTMRLTEGVAFRGLGNRPGALQMNSGFRWPYGRREGILPIWAYRRAAAPGALRFRRVVFQNRIDEGRASQTSTDQSPDNYYCLSLQHKGSELDVDAVSCASTFNSDKGMFITTTHVQNGYSEPWRVVQAVSRRALSLDSLYPPRRDVLVRGIYDHPDLDEFRADALRVMPEIDAITMATAPAEQAQLIQFDIPAEWPNGDYVVYVEVNTEKDHNGTYSVAAYPTPNASTVPSSSAEDYDWWAINYGFAYRGQPSVVYAIPFSNTAAGGSFTATTPVGYSDNQGLDGTLRPIDGTITDDPAGAPGSGADRLRSFAQVPRVSVTLLSTDICNAPEPPPECGFVCASDAECPAGFLCGAMGTCLGECDVVAPPPAPGSFTVAPYPDEKHTHEWARLSFVAPMTRRPVLRYDVRVSPTPITNDLEFRNALNAKAASLEIQAVSVCEATGVDITCPDPGAQVAVDVGWLNRLSTYYIAVRAYDACGVGGGITTGQLKTTDINFTTVSPCFVATAAYGSPMASDVQALRAFRDAHLMTSTPGRAFVTAYYAVGPYLAAFIREHEDRRSIARALLSPFVALARLLDDAEDSE